MQTLRNIDRRTTGPAPFGAPVNASAPQQVPNERRGTARTMWAWASLHGNDAIPELADLLGPHRVIAEQEFLLKTDPLPHLSVFILCGDALRAILGRPILGSTFWDCMPRAARDTLSQACAAALMQGAPVQESGTFQNEAGVETRYRGVFMPLRSPGRDDPGYLFGAYGSRVFGAMTPATA